MMVNALIQKGDVVIEFGARFGTTSCILSRAVGSTGHVISVEPDHTVHGHLLRNRHDHKCDYHVVLGTVSEKPLFIAKKGGSGYGLRTTEISNDVRKEEVSSLPNTDVATIEQILHKRINVALIDCEGK
mmetsp:Transcript_29557/g.41383  ORF Transcript_29557/g.41383 Transcript_29557/m.41383 type:complete len:129 (-) Transcript_29557:683-1069(-)